ncbi:CoA ester lyase [Caballeronia sp. GAWG2-1]|uniref:HpcH/HpaI aldolase/citrate lyase family protein n=1 Tax=Caballeronia sp. GAWG2-1 TaxID=2921744 RepID=UPI0020296516|nr:CoA ester lyase [Caballeronia sp. GAWG2-1]
MRSLLFVPAHDARKLAKSMVSGADALILDLEDSVPDADKARARGTCAEFIQEHRDRIRLFVRVNGIDTGLTAEDLAVAVAARPYGIMLPKAHGAKDVATVATWLLAIERRAGIAEGSTKVLPIVTETAAALFEMQTYSNARNARLCGMLWGGEDLSADIGARSSRAPDGRYAGPYALARSMTLLGATAAGVDAVDAVYTDFRNAAGLRAESEEAVRDGFSSKAAIHPDQVPVINAAFTPSSEDTGYARQVIAAFENSPGAGAVAIDGKMLDRPHLRAAQRVLQRAERAAL